MCVIVSGVLAAGPASAQQRPLETHDPEAIPDGTFLFETGVVYLTGQGFPVSGLRGRYTNAPNIGFAVGVGGVAEFQVRHASFQYLRVTERSDAPLDNLLRFDGSTTREFDDLVVGAKVRLVAEREARPSLGFHFSTRLPNASAESGLGKDTMDFRNSVLIGKTFRRVRAVFNLGLGILGDPTSAMTQNDVVLYGMSLVGRVSERVEAVWEVNGHRNQRARNVPPGTDSSAFVRAGMRYRLGHIRLDGAVMWGVYDADAPVGGMVGLSVLFGGAGAS